MPQNIGDNRISEVGIARIAPDDAQRLSKYLVKTGDIVYSRRGDVERRSLIRDHENGWLCGTGCLRVSFGEKRVVHPPYAAYYLGHPLVREWIVRHAQGATMPNLNTSILSALPFVLPPFEEQERIAGILADLEDKIELNRQINQTLEQIAQAIFKSWFVDFEPVKAKIEAKAAGRDPERAAMCAISGKLEPELDQLPPEHYQQLAATAALFPDELVESELGLIPVGWEVKRLDSFAALNTKSVSPNTEPESNFEHYSIPAFDAAGRPVYESGESIKSNKYKVEPHSVLVSKLNPETPRIWLPNVQTSRAVCSTEFMQFVPKSKVDRPYLFLLMKSETMQSEILQRVTGSTGSRQRAQPSQIAVLPVALPSAELRLAFSGMVSSLLNQIALQVGQGETLATLRDTLLPKLLSGEMTVESAQDEVAVC